MAERGEREGETGKYTRSAAHASATPFAATLWHLFYLHCRRQVAAGCKLQAPLRAVAVAEAVADAAAGCGSALTILVINICVMDFFIFCWPLRTHKVN